MNECVLVVDDDREIVKAIAILLEKEGYQVCRAYDGLQALDILMSREVHLILMDIMMPKLDGLSALMKIREQKNLPVIGLSMGADDYIAKPYLPQELVARVRSHLRRYMSLGSIHEQAREGRLENGRLSYSRQEKTLYVDGEPVKLTATETKIMELFMENPGRVFPAEEIYSRVWGEEAFSPENTVMVHIRRIREKIEINSREPEYIKVVWGIGYKMEKK